MRKYNRSDKWSATKGTTLGTKPPGTAPDLIWFLSTPSKRVTVRSRKWEGDIAPVSCVWFPLTGGAWRDHDCKPQCAHVSSYGENGLRFLLSVWIENTAPTCTWHDRVRTSSSILTRQAEAGWADHQWFTANTSFMYVLVFCMCKCLVSEGITVSMSGKTGDIN